MSIPKDLMALKVLKRVLPGNKSLSTFHRWRERGCIGSDGQCHRLKMTKIGGVFYVSEAEFRRWMQAVAGENDSNEPFPLASTTESDNILDRHNV